MSDQLSKDYVIELIKSCLSSNRVLDICSTHLKYEFLQTEAQKKVVKFIFDTFFLQGTSPTVGTIAQAFPGNADIIGLLQKIKNTNINGKEQQIIGSFETFIKDLRFQAILKKVADLYNANKQEEATKELAKESISIEQFTLKTKYYVKVFAGFEQRMQKRADAAVNDILASVKERLTTGIHEFDFFTKGGFRKGTSFLAMARSGIGKTTYLRWCAITNARLGKKVVIFQNEDTSDNSLEAMDAAWTSITGEDIEDGHYPTQLKRQILKIKEEILARGGEIILVTTESFNAVTIEECREKLIEIIKLEGPIDMVLFDYLEVFTTKGHNAKGEAAERRRREDIGNKMTSMAIEFNIVVGTATQSADVEPEKLKNPDFVMTRNHASEFKNVIKPFSYFFTFNCTPDEYESEQLRIYIDKMRKHKANKTIKICQSRGNGRFYDSARTKEMFDSFNHAT